MVAQTTIFNRPRSSSEFLKIDLHAYIDIIIVLILFLCLIFLIYYSFAAWKLTNGTSLRILIYYYILCAISSLWSNHYSYTLFRSFEFISALCSIIVIFYFYSNKNFYKFEKYFFIISIVIIIMTFSFYLKKNNWVISSIKQLHTNSYTTSAAMLGGYCIGEILNKNNKRKLKYLFISLFALIFLFLGTSTASYLAFLFGMSLLFIISGRPLILLYAIIFGATIFITTSYEDLISLLFYQKSQQSINNLTGRLSLWADYWDLFLDSPFWGYGFAVANRISTKYYATNAHNSIFSVVLGTGIVGISIVAYGTFRLIKEGITNFKKAHLGSYGCTIAITIGLINSMSYAFMCDIWYPSSIIFILLICLNLNTNRDNNPTQKRNSLNL